VAGADRMTVEEVVRKVLLDEHADVIREAVKAVAAELMELEVSGLIGAERGERRPQDRGDASQWVSVPALGHPRR
jgi:putative transposase